MNREDVRREAERELGDRPGVVAVALGYKFKDGELTDVLALRVYVERKKAAAELTDDELMPAEYGGMPTDVLEPPRIVEAVGPEPCADHRPPGTLTGGISISTLRDAPDGSGKHVGTLGFLATITGATAPNDIALVTCNHVITKSGGAVDRPVYQPAWEPPEPDGSVLLAPIGASEIGPVLRLPDRKENAQLRYVDAASVRLDFCISSWCNSNLRNSFDADIQGLAIGGHNDIHDVATLDKEDEIVVKVGRRTGRTVGKVTAVAVPCVLDTSTLFGNIEIAPVSMKDGTKNCGGPLRFAAKGDSGAALIDSKRNLIGLVHGIVGNLTYACHIQPVLDALNVVPITEQNPVHGHPAAVVMRDQTAATIEAGPDRRAELRGAVLATAAGRALAAEADRHRLEVVHLVNHARRVTIAWHRNQGPAYVNRLLANARDPAVPIPYEIDGITRAQLLNAMADVLSQHGSPELAAAIASRRDVVLARTADVEDLQQLVDDLAGARVS